MEDFYLKFPKDNEDSYVAYQRYANLLTYIKLYGSPATVVNTFPISVSIRNYTVCLSLEHIVFTCENVVNGARSEWHMDVPDYWHSKKCVAYMGQPFTRPMDFVTEFYEFMNDYLDADA